LLGLVDDLKGEGNGADGVKWHYRKQTVEELEAMSRLPQEEALEGGHRMSRSWIEWRAEAVHEAIDTRPVIFFSAWQVAHLQLVQA
jgi:hypothetical protein